MYNFGSDINRTELAPVFQFCSKVCIELTCFSECVMRKLLLKIFTSLFVWSVICINSSGIINRNICHMCGYVCVYIDVRMCTRTHTSRHVVCFWFTPTEYGFWNSGTWYALVTGILRTGPPVIFWFPCSGLDFSVVLCHLVAVYIWYVFLKEACFGSRVTCSIHDS